MTKTVNKWFLIYTKNNEEKRAKEHLNNQGFEVLLPMISYKRKNESEPKKFETMFPRYLFIKVPSKDVNWSKIKSTRGVHHLVVFGLEPAEVPYKVVDHLKSHIDKNGTVEQEIIQLEYKRFDKLEITEGPFEGNEATFLYKKSNERVKVLLKFINQVVTAEIPESVIGRKEILETFKF